jgi:hypothetical protein
MYIRANQKSTKSDQPMQMATPCFAIPTDPSIPISKLQCRRSKPRGSKPTVLGVDQVSKLTSYERACTPRVLTDHHLIPDPHLFVCSNQDQVQPAQVSNLRGNVLGRCDRLRKTSRTPGTPWDESFGQLNVAPGFQFPKSLKAAACLSSTHGIEESIAFAESLCDSCSVHMAVLIEHRSYVLDYFRPRQCSFNLVLGFHANMLHGMETIVQS